MAGHARDDLSSDQDLLTRLRAGETWRFEPEPGQTVAWVSAAHGTVRASAPIAAGEMVVFDEGHDAIDFHADSDTFFVLGSACKHPHELFLGYYSVHTNAKALEKGENGIREVAVASSVEAAVRALAPDARRILICGSLYLAGKVLADNA